METFDESLCQQCNLFGIQSFRERPGTFFAYQYSEVIAAENCSLCGYLSAEAGVRNDEYNDLYFHFEAVQDSKDYQIRHEDRLDGAGIKRIDVTLAPRYYQMLGGHQTRGERWKASFVAVADPGLPPK
jgi:hypothetical protein